MQEYKKLKSVILKNQNGFTCNFKGKIVSKTEGYFLSITNIKGKQIKPLIKKVISIKQKGFNENKNLLLGGWLDNNDKTFYLDLSLYLEEKGTALKIAKLFNQKAIFDIKNSSSVYI